MELFIKYFLNQIIAKLTPTYIFIMFVILNLIVNYYRHYNGTQFQIKCVNQMHPNQATGKLFMFFGLPLCH